jgi:ComF family protein
MHWLEQDCLLCGASCGARILCDACEADLPWLKQPACPQCALPTPDGQLCGRCLSDPPYFDATQVVYCYSFPIDKLMQSFKYNHRLALGAYFGQQMARLPRPASAIDLIIPLPLHPARLRERGFNQSLELAKFLASAWGIPVDKYSCQRIRNTPAQAGLPWKERRKNIRNAFHCASDLQGKQILLVDDVMTTGTSLSECARVLKSRGAARVSVLVVARTLPV